MHLFRCLFFSHFHLCARHTAGMHKGLADALPRGNLHLFQAHRERVAQPTEIPQDLVDLLINTKPDWLEASVHKCLQHSIAESTRKSYLAAQKRYSEFCGQFNLASFPLE